MNEFFSDELNLIVSYLKKETETEMLYNEIAVFGSQCGLKQYLTETVKQLDLKGNKKALLYISDFENNDKYTQSKELSEILSTIDDSVDFIYIPVFSLEKPIAEAVSLSEGEFNSISLPSLKAVTENECVLFSFNRKTNCCSARFSNIFGPAIESSGDFKSIAEDYIDGKVVLSENDYNFSFSASYIRSAVKIIFRILLKGKSGEAYNCCNLKFTAAEAKNVLFKLFSDKLTLSLNNSKTVFNGSKCFSDYKIKTIGCNFETDIEDAIFRSFSDDSDIYTRRFTSELYDGKIENIRMLEIEMLDEVKRICEENDINYFLVGGTLLGAVRHKGFIPWDDDIDICFLREDYERFRKICPKELNEKYSYQSYRDEKGTHYVYDKIRLKNTFFSTEHSYRHEDMENGVFIDLLVFDKTSNNKLLRKLHVFLIVMLRRLINIRWTKEPVEGKFATISKLILPLVCLLPFSFYHSALEVILKIFRRNKKSKFLLDGTGLHIKKGGFPKEWMEEFVNVIFEGEEYTAPKRSADYLERWYGKNYMAKPAISNRVSGHKAKRLDLGDYLNIETKMQS